MTELMVMGNNDWYRNKNWDDQIESAFRARLKRSRGDYYFKRDTSYLAASSLSVSRSFRASMDTFALNQASYFFLLFFMVLSYYFLI